MKELSDVDPYLHTLRSLTLNVGDEPARSTLELARYRLFEAFRDRRPDRARAWSSSLRACIVEHLHNDSRSSALDALDRIDKAIP